MNCLVQYEYYDFLILPVLKGSDNFQQAVITIHTIHIIIMKKEALSNR